MSKPNGCALRALTLCDTNWVLTSVGRRLCYCEQLEQLLTGGHELEYSDVQHTRAVEVARACRTERYVEQCHRGEELRRLASENW